MAVPLTIKRLILNQPADLPVFHPIAIRLQVLLETVDFKMQDVIDLVNEDPVLAGQILKIANSPIYVGRVPSETIREAVIRVGASRISNLAMAVSQSNLHLSDNELINDCLLSLWLHSHACAVGCAWVASTCGHPGEADRAYMAGLLHDIGKLYLLKAVERLNKVNVAQKAAEEAMLIKIFREMHIEIGSQVMTTWNMPKVYCDIVAQHDARSFDPHDLLLVMVRFVNQACNAKGLGPGPAPEVEIAELPENRILKLRAAQIDELMGLLHDSRVELPIPVEQKAGARSYEINRRPFNLGWELVFLEAGLVVDRRTAPRGTAGFLEAERAGKAWLGHGKIAAEAA